MGGVDLVRFVDAAFVPGLNPPGRGLAAELEAAGMAAWHRSEMNTELMKTVCSDKIYRSHRVAIP